MRPVWLVPGATGEPGDWTEHFVDLHRDQTVADVWRATGAGMRNVEHVKRYTSIGTGAEQGKTSSVVAIGVIAAALRWAGGSRTNRDTRPTVRRTPRSRSLALAGRERGDLFDPARTTAVHSWHVEAGAEMEIVGQWLRPWYYPAPGEDIDAAVARECRAAREGVAMMDASTLGKIEVRGADAGEFLNRIYTNAFKKLPVGSARYGVMCRPDGMMFDDGVNLRLAEDRYFLTTTTGGAAGVLDWLEEWLQTEWPDLDVVCTSVTEQWTTVAVVGPPLTGRAGACGPRPRRLQRRLRLHDVPRDHPGFWRSGSHLPDLVLRRAGVRGQRVRLVRPCRVGGAVRRGKRPRDHAVRHRDHARAAGREGLSHRRSGH